MSRKLRLRQKNGFLLKKRVCGEIMLAPFVFPTKNQKPEVFSYEIPRNKPNQKQTFHAESTSLSLF